VGRIDSLFGANRLTFWGEQVSRAKRPGANRSSGRNDPDSASDNDLLLCRKSTSNKTRCRQWFDRCITSKMILKSGSNWLFPVVFSVEITLSGSHSGNSFEFSHRLTDFLNYALFCLSFCLSLNLKPVNYFTTKRSSMAKHESGSIRPNSLFALGPFVLIIIIM
jgi:hypothetical protein